MSRKKASKKRKSEAWINSSNDKKSTFKRVSQPYHSIPGLGWNFGELLCSETSRFWKCSQWELAPGFPGTVRGMQSATWLMTVHHWQAGHRAELGLFLLWASVCLPYAADTVVNVYVWKLTPPMNSATPPRWKAVSSSWSWLWVLWWICCISPNLSDSLIHESLPELTKKAKQSPDRSLSSPRWTHSEPFSWPRACYLRIHIEEYATISS